MESENKTKCLFDNTKVCPENCKLHAFIVLAKALGATETEEPKRKDPELGAQCKLKEN